MKVVAILPCFNEEASIEATITSIRRVIPTAEIWVVDNASTDGTKKKAESLNVRVLAAPMKGKGYAVRTAFSRIGKDVDLIFMLDGDDTYEVSPFLQAASLILDNGYDMIVGERVPQEIDVSRKEVFRKGHKTGNRLLSKIFQLIFRIEITDTLSGWRVMSRGFVQSFLGGDSGFEIETELNAHAFLIQAPITSVKVAYSGRLDGSTSKLNTYRDGSKILRRIFTLYTHLRPFAAYSMLALPWLVSSVVLVRNVLNTYFQTQLIPNFPSLIAGVGCFMVALLLWITGMILEKVKIGHVDLARSLYSVAYRG
jgi:glycosyltransferase involved in cell wall biosynthesis